MQIRISHPFPNVDMLRQTPGGKGVWNDCRFIVNEPADECDAWVVVEGLAENQACVCPPERTIFVTQEPPSQPRYPEGFLSQFAAILTCHKFKSHKNVIRRQQGLLWWVGLRKQKYETQQTVLDFDSLSVMNSIPKSRNLSMICSRVDQLPTHRQRIRFAERIYSHFGDQIDLFGQGWRPIPDKWDAIAPYRYHIAIENSPWPDYWTEKLSDTYLGGAMPIYGGCPNVDEYFDPRSLLKIDISRPEESIRAIEHAILSNQYEKQREYIWQSRRRVLDEHNFFPMIAQLAKTLAVGSKKRISLKPNIDFAFSFRERALTCGLKASRDTARLFFRASQRLRGSPFAAHSQK